jgi:hypothetical protein
MLTLVANSTAGRPDPRPGHERGLERDEEATTLRISYPPRHVAY